MTRSYPDRGTRALAKLSLGEWLGGVLCVAVLLGAMVLADALGAWVS